MLVLSILVFKSPLYIVPSKLYSIALCSMKTGPQRRSLRWLGLLRRAAAQCRPIVPAGQAGSWKRDGQSLLNLLCKHKEIHVFWPRGFHSRNFRGGQSFIGETFLRLLSLFDACLQLVAIGIVSPGVPFFVAHIPVFCFVSVCVNPPLAVVTEIHSVTH